LGVVVIPFCVVSEIRGFIEELLFFVSISVPLSPFLATTCFLDASPSSILAEGI
jgi:hypothetical protein